MKPCSKHRKNIVWLTLSALDGAQERDLQTHLENCPACRTYWKEVSALTGKLSATPEPSRVEASERFHQQVVRVVCNQSEGSTDGLLKDWHFWSWRVALPVMGVVAVLVAALPLGQWRSHTFGNSSPALSSQRAIRVDIEPSVFNYQMAANASLDGLDELLTSQGNRNPPDGRYPGPPLAGATTME